MSAGPSTSGSPPPTPVIVDCDTGIDDSLALLHLLSLSGGADQLCEVAGIVCTAGNVGVDDTVRNTLGWLDLVRAPDIPVAVGAGEPIAVWHPLTPETHGPRGVGHARLPEPRRSPDGRTGAQLWVDAARERPGRCVGGLLGPASTLAGALEIEPRLPHLLDRLVVMGGSFRGHPGNTTAVAEWNVHVDPEAADSVCRTWRHARQVDPGVAPILWCGLDLTEGAVLAPEHLDALPQTPVADHVRDALRFYFEFHDRMGQGYLAHVHDPACLHLALHPSLPVADPAEVREQCRGQHTRGMTVARFGLPPHHLPNAEVLATVRHRRGMPGVVDDVVDSISRLLRRC